MIVVFFGVWAAKVLDDNEAHAEQRPRDHGHRLQLRASSYRYDSDGGFTRNDGLYLPVGETITLHMITPLFTPGTKNLEVIHGFWVPEWGVKQDATPGVIGKTVGTTYVKPTRVGTYEVQCTELCGSGHGEMHLQEHPRALADARSTSGSTDAKAEAAKAKPQARRPTRASPSSTARAAAAATRFTPAKSTRQDGPVAG